ALLEVVLVTVALSGRSIGRIELVYSLHVVLGLGSCLAIAVMAGRVWTVRASPLQRGIILGGAALVLPAVCLAAYTYSVDSYYRNLTATTRAQAANPLFPAGTHMNSNDWKSAPGSDSCASAGCHEQ